MFTSNVGFLTYSMHHHRKNNLIKLTHYDETKKRAHNSQIVRAKGKFQLRHGGPSQIHALETKLYVRAVIEFEAQPTVVQLKKG